MESGNPEPDIDLGSISATFELSWDNSALSQQSYRCGNGQYDCKDHWFPYVGGGDREKRKDSSFGSHRWPRYPELRVIRTQFF